MIVMAIIMAVLMIVGARFMDVRVLVRFAQQQKIATTDSASATRKAGSGSSRNTMNEISTPAIGAVPNRAPARAAPNPRGDNRQRRQALTKQHRQDKRDRASTQSLHQHNLQRVFS